MASPSQPEHAAWPVSEPSPTIEKVIRHINQCRVQSAYGSYLPHSLLRGYMNEALIQEVLSSSNLSLTDCNIISRDYLSVFTILVCLNKVEYIRHFVACTDLSDLHLPFRTSEHWPSECVYFFEDFRRRQWEFCVRSLDNPLTVPRLLDVDEVLPITQKIKIHEGKHSATYKVTVDPEYNHLSKQSNVFVLKTCLVNAASKFANELEAYSALLKKANAASHMIHFYGSFTHNGIFNVLFEYADYGSLEHFFKNEQPPRSVEEELEFWDNLVQLMKPLIEVRDLRDRSQMATIMHAICDNITPANILATRSSSQSKYSLRFKLADFCLKEIDPDPTLSKNGDQKPFYGTEMYSAPECWTYRPFLQRSSNNIDTGIDIWSLGTIFSEAVVWSILGREGLEDYTARRREATSSNPQLQNSGYSGCFHDGYHALGIIRDMHKHVLNRRHHTAIIATEMSNIAEDMLDEAAARPKALSVYKRCSRALQRAHEQTLRLAVGSSDPKSTSSNDILVPPIFRIEVRAEGIFGARSETVTTDARALQDSLSTRNEPPFVRQMLHTSVDAERIIASNKNTLTPASPIRIENKTSKNPHVTVRETFDWMSKMKAGGFGGKTPASTPPLAGLEYSRRLVGRDQIFLIDDSISMTPYWPEVIRVFEALAYVLKSADPNGIELYFTNSSVQSHWRSRRDPSKILKTIRPQGSCAIQRALPQILDKWWRDYTTAKERPRKLQDLWSKRRKKEGLSLYILTDGVWQDTPPPLCGVEEPIRDMVKKLTKKSLSSDHVGIQFIRFGDDEVGTSRLDILDHGLRDFGIHEDIVDTEPSSGNIWKMLLGSLDPLWDRIAHPAQPDEHRLPRASFGANFPVPQTKLIPQSAKVPVQSPNELVFNLSLKPKIDVHGSKLDKQGIPENDDRSNLNGGRPLDNAEKDTARESELKTFSNDTPIDQTMEDRDFTHGQRMTGLGHADLIQKGISDQDVVHVLDFIQRHGQAIKVPGGFSFAPVQDATAHTDSGYASGRSQSMANGRPSTEISNAGVDTASNYTWPESAAGDFLTYVEDLSNLIFKRGCLENLHQDQFYRIMHSLPNLLDAFAEKLSHGGHGQIQSELLGNTGSFVQRYRRLVTTLIRSKYEPERDLNDVRDPSDLQPLSITGWRDGVENHNREIDISSNEAQQDAIDDISDNDSISTGSNETEDAYDQYHNAILGSKALEWLLLALKRESRLTNLDNPLDVQSSIYNQLLDHIPRSCVSRNAVHICKAKFSLEWNPMAFLQEQGYSGEPYHAIENAVVLTGSLCDAQATTCGQYLYQTWPISGPIVMSLLQDIVRSSMNGSIFTYYLPDQSELRAGATQTHFVFEVIGPRHSIAEVGEQLAWLTAALRQSPHSRLALSSPYLQDIRKGLENSKGRDIQTLDCTISTHLRLSARSNESNDGKQFPQGECWHSLFNNPVVVTGFPIKSRTEPDMGLEMPFGLLSELTTRRIAKFGSSVFIKSFSYMLYPTKKIGDTVVWHYQASKDASGISYKDASILPLGLDFDDVMPESIRHIVGWCDSVVNQAGTKSLDHLYGTVLDSRLSRTHATAVLKSVTVTAGKFVTVSTTFQLGGKDKPKNTSSEKEYLRRLERLADKSFVLWDEDDARGWLIRGLHALLHLIRESIAINMKGEFKDYYLGLPDDLDGAGSPMEILMNEHNRRSKISSRENLDFEDRVIEVLELLENIIEEQNQQPDGWRLKMTPKRCLEGFSFRDIAQRARESKACIAKLPSFLGKGWVDLVKAIGATVLFGAGFGEIIQPAIGSQETLCHEWRRLPKWKYYLAVCIDDLKRIVSTHHGDIKTTPLLLTPTIMLHSPGNHCDTCSLQKQAATIHHEYLHLPYPTYFSHYLPKAKQIKFADGAGLVFGQNKWFSPRYVGMVKVQAGLSTVMNKTTVNGKRFAIPLKESKEGSDDVLDADDGCGLERRIPGQKDEETDKPGYVRIRHRRTKKFQQTDMRKNNQRQPESHLIPSPQGSQDASFTQVIQRARSNQNVISNLLGQPNPVSPVHSNDTVPIKGPELVPVSRAIHQQSRLAAPSMVTSRPA